MSGSPRKHCINILSIRKKLLFKHSANLFGLSNAGHLYVYQLCSSVLYLCALPRVWRVFECWMLWWGEGMSAAVARAPRSSSLRPGTNLTNPLFQPLSQAPSSNPCPKLSSLPSSQPQLNRPDPRPDPCSNSPSKLLKSLPTLPKLETQPTLLPEEIPPSICKCKPGTKLRCIFKWKYQYVA